VDTQHSESLCNISMIFITCLNTSKKVGSCNFCEFSRWLPNLLLLISRSVRHIYILYFGIYSHDFRIREIIKSIINNIGRIYIGCHLEFIFIFNGHQLNRDLLVCKAHTELYCSVYTHVF
jgi:hypothetical protein